MMCATITRILQAKLRLDSKTEFYKTVPVYWLVAKHGLVVVRQFKESRVFRNVVPTRRASIHRADRNLNQHI